MDVSTPQDKVHRFSLDHPEEFWDNQAQQLLWHKPYLNLVVQTPKVTAYSALHHQWSWFPDGEFSTSYNCVHRHVESGNADNVAIIWESLVTGRQEQLTYGQLQDEVEHLSGVLRALGVKKGDVVLLYMPTIPTALVAALAIVNLGAIHAAVFGGFAARPLAERISDAKPRIVEDAIQRSSFKPSSVLVWDRQECPWGELDTESGQKDWKSLVAEAKLVGNRVGPVPVKGADTLYIIYTSGTTSTPKGIPRPAAGHAVGLLLSTRYLFDIKGPGDVIFCTSDIGWVVGHSYILYGPLLVGATTLIYEGKPVGTPDAGALWRLIQKYQVNVLSTAPTTLRAISRDDPESAILRALGKAGALRTLRALFVAGERSEPEIIQKYEDLLARFAAPHARVIDTWWSSETGSPITGIALNPAGVPYPSKGLLGVGSIQAAVRPGAAGKAMPGFDVHVVNEGGVELGAGETGNLVLGLPLGPTAFTTLFNNEERFYRGYLERFQGRWLDTGDRGTIDKDGYIHIMGRSDDVINVAAHRFSAGEIEQAILLHPEIAEAAVIGIPDPVKGHLPFAFVRPRSVSSSTSPVVPGPLFAAINRLVRTSLGPVASLEGIIQGDTIIPKTRSGKVLRRTLRELVENAARGDFGAEVSFPPTIEDAAVVSRARGTVKDYFAAKASGRRTKL
ncbi:acyl-CoA synthetase [Aspergillus pseudodeflectus]|uniref:Acyl-CoA synthetase n=1 Tax=Aspergillus pseudodeflectus TaxID=176178 RepID=A0ABR4JCN4_9EURO